MSIPFFLPITEYTPLLKLEKFFTIAELCKKAKIKCLASGDWVNRKIGVCYNDNFKVEAEPGDWGNVRITLSKSNMLKLNSTKEAQLALTILAYSLHDLVAKESIKNHDFSKVRKPMGRIKTGKALSNKERQKLFRSRLNK